MVEQKKKSSTGKIILIILGVLVVIGIIGNLTEDSEKNDETATQEKKANASSWQYKETTDEMTSRTCYYATTTSTNKIEFEFPYEGGSTFYLGVTSRGKGNEIYLKTNKGQFMTSIMSSEYVRVKFDENGAFDYTYNSPSNGSSDIIFIDNPDHFINQLKNAKKLRIEAPFFNTSRQIVRFDVENLKWER